MLTPQEVSEHAFAKASFGGYNMAMVDEFLDLLTEDYTTLYKENAALKAKMKVLVDTVEEYRSSEGAMRKALLSAQRIADEMVAEAESKKAELLRNAEADAKARIAELAREIQNEQFRLSAAQAATAAYVSKLKELYQHEAEYLGGLSSLAAPAPRPADPVAQTASDITAAVDRLVAGEEQETPVPEAEPAKPSQLKADSLYDELVSLSRPSRAEEAAGEDGDEEDAEPTRRIDFDHLQFGKDYEIK